ncbi:DNA-(apurinic or apyrimidinic site) endonuclease [Macadamia integrifolia]|uniref:DNA-(apurinic or apyrimidinic site) endonuclease n=1 Tax=Macadamia integrifolia TaxID=60698 RepID=UPI001C4E7D85|nr:DNA-(apurinic or apyrimidinic site) endonuclease [Macadamia integrifolia]XP_042481898.1 DNA-(apurinic or apyrimidinic site) endonuclease [Macadamia integrifolia]XP_042481906.1 DNA-(apurinic or apyrimidinic site) endonuclease [Macadamia integrifolia]
MKRFFQPIQKEGSCKKPSLSSSPGTAEDQQDGKSSDKAEDKKEPVKFLTWNANSLLLRVKNNWPEFTKFVQSFDPDVIAVQEVRMPASGSKGAPKNPGELKDDTSASREEKQILIRALSTPPFGNYRVWWSLADSKYAGTALFVKKCCQPKKVHFSLDRSAKHEPDGRVILAEFESFRLLNTYAPNNGWKEEETSFQRRRKWDKRILEFVVQSSDKPLIWCGDLNVSHQEIDVSHPDFFSSAKLNGYIPPNKEDCGQPGFTLAERKRFSSILSEGKLIDAYRFLHKEKDMECGFSWSGNPIGKYRGKRMRIDYFIVSEKLKERIVTCEMHGKGIELQGFFGSDHCPVSLELSAPSMKSN